MPLQNKKIQGYLTKFELEALDKVKTELKTKWPDIKIKLFGSKITGEFDEESDLDLLILLPCKVTESMRRKIIHKVFEINLQYDTNISPLILSKNEWEGSVISSLQVHYFIEKEGVLL